MPDSKRLNHINDEPGAEERFKRGIERALKTPPKPHKEAVEERKAKHRKKDDAKDCPCIPFAYVEESGYSPLTLSRREQAHAQIHQVSASWASHHSIVRLVGPEPVRHDRNWGQCEQSVAHYG